MSDTIKTRLEAVSSSLDTAIDKANNLPDAGSGSGSGSVEIKTFTCEIDKISDASDMYYINSFFLYSLFF